MIDASDVDRVIPAGCVVVVDPEQDAAQGSVALVLLENERLLRRVFRGRNGMMLSPDTTREADDIFASQCDARVLGPVVWWQSNMAMA